jgi:hypothetical protein
MNRILCERESDVVEALRRGSFSGELRGHVRSCSICTETHAVAEMLLQTASLLRVEHEPSAAGLIWRRAQVRKNELALKRATRPLIVMRAMSAVYVVFSAAWLLHYFWRSGSMESISGWNGFLDETAWFGVAIAVLAMAIGAWYLLRDGGHSGEGIPST